MTTGWGGKCDKDANFLLHPPPPHTSLEAYSLLYLYLYCSVFVVLYHVAFGKKHLKKFYAH